MEMAFASFLSYALLLLQFFVGSKGHKFFMDTSKEFSIDKLGTNPQGFFVKTEASPEELLTEKSTTNPQEFFIKTKFNPNFVEESEINPQGIHFIGFYSKPHIQDLNPAFNHVFFKASDFFLGKKLPIYFYTDENSTPSNSHLLSQDEADSIPFSSSRLPDLLESFSIPNHSPQAEAMKDTLKVCEAKPKEGLFKFCATSFEFMLDRTRGFLGTDKPRVLATKILSSDHVLLQNYTIVKEPLEIRSKKVVVCHIMAYPYRVYYCHNSHEGRSNKLMKMALVGDNGERVEAMAVCHMDTSKWDPNHVSFKVIGGQPGTTPVCHILPADNIAWIPSP